MFQNKILLNKHSLDSSSITCRFTVHSVFFSHSLCACVRVTALTTLYLPFFSCYCCSCPQEESSYYIAVDVLVQHDAHVSVCVLLFPACRAGFYKSSLGNMECSKCPPHSFSHHEGSLYCSCEKNYFRAEGDPASMACTRKCPCSLLTHLSLKSKIPVILIHVQKRPSRWFGVFTCLSKEVSLKTV